MNYDEIEILAAKGNPLPGHCDLETLYCYHLLRDLYKGYRNKNIDLELARAKKKEIRLAYLEAESIHNRQRACWAQYQEFLQKSCSLTYEIRHALENAVEASTLVPLVMQLYGNLTGDFTTANLILEKMGEGENQA